MVRRTFVSILLMLIVAFASTLRAYPKDGAPTSKRSGGERDKRSAPSTPEGVTVLAFDATLRKLAPFAKWTTGVIAPKPDQLVLLWVGISRTTGPVKVPTVSGADIERKLEKTLDVNGGPRRLCLFSGISDAPTKGQLMIDFDGQKQRRAFWAAIQFDKAFSVAQVGTAPDSTARDGAGEVTFASPPAGPVAAFIIGSIRSDIVSASGMHELGELHAVHRIHAAYSPSPLNRSIGPGSAAYTTSPLGRS